MRGTDPLRGSTSSLRHTPGWNCKGLLIPTHQVRILAEVPLCGVRHMLCLAVFEREGLTTHSIGSHLPQRSGSVEHNKSMPHCRVRRSTSLLNISIPLLLDCSNDATNVVCGGSIPSRGTHRGLNVRRESSPGLQVPPFLGMQANGGKLFAKQSGVTP